MKFYLYRNSQTYGPYSEESIQEYIRSGRASENDWACRKGEKKWERSYKDRQLIGPVTWWYESGQKNKELHHKYGGKMHGPATWW